MDAKEMNKILKQLNVPLNFLCSEMKFSYQHISNVLTGNYNCTDGFKKKFVQSIVKKFSIDEMKNQKLRKQHDDMFIDEDEVFSGLQKLHVKQDLKKQLEKDEKDLNVRKDIFFSSIKNTDWKQD